MRDLKFRQAIFINGQFSHFHYWGFYLPAWIPPNLELLTKNVHRGKVVCPYCGKEFTIR